MFVKLHDHIAVLDYLKTRVPIVYASPMTNFAFKFMREQNGFEVTDGSFALSKEDTEAIIPLIVVLGAMIQRDGDNRAAGRVQEYGAVINPTRSWIDRNGPIQKDWKMYRVMELAYAHPEATDLLHEVILQRGYIQTEILEAMVEQTPLSISQGTL